MNRKIPKVPKPLAGLATSTSEIVTKVAVEFRTLFSAGRRTRVLGTVFQQGKTIGGHEVMEGEGRDAFRSTSLSWVGMYERSKINGQTVRLLGIKMPPCAVGIHVEYQCSLEWHTGRIVIE